MSTPIETINNTAAPVNTGIPSHNETPVAVNVQEHSVNDSTTGPTTATVPNTANGEQAKVTPIQRINTVWNKTKRTFNEVISDAQRNVNEKNNTTTVGEGATTTATAAPQKDHADKKVSTHSNTWKDILNRAKGSKPTPTTHSTTQEQPPIASTSDNTGINSAPVPPPKDNIKPASTQHHSGSPVVDQLKRNATLLATFILQKKKDYTEKKSSDNNARQQQATTASATPELHDETITANPTVPTTSGQHNTIKPSSSPLARRISQLVNGATTNLNKRRDTHKANVSTTNTAAPAPVTTVVEETPVTNNTTTTT